MKVFLDEVKGNYDYVILDSPPLISVADAQAIAPVIDGVLLVISAEETEISEAKKSVELLKYIKANILGIVLNKVKSNNKNYYYYKEHTNKEHTNNKIKKVV
jgi:Mrp family chromosome partitioning ATPase